MEFDTKDRQLDIVAVLVLSTLLLFVILLFDVSWLRIVLGLPFVLFFPGYSLVSALFPRQDRPSLVLKGKKDEKGPDLICLSVWRSRWGFPSPSCRCSDCS